MNKIKLSIITISYNSEKTIERTIKSVLAQTYKDFEYIIVDGGSTDLTIEIIMKYEPLFEGRLKWKSEPDNGIYDAMNKGIHRSTGEIIGIVNSDDWIEPTAMTAIAKFAENVDYKNTLICGSMNFHYEDGHTQLFLSDEEKFFKGIKNYSFNYGAYHPAIWVGKNVYDSVGLFDCNYKTAADIDFIYRCYLEKKNFIFIPEVVTNMSDGGISNNINWKYFIADKKYYVKKYNYSYIGGFLYIFSIVLKAYVRQLVPSWLIKYYRDFKLK